jgi:hypothetical protein
LIAKGHELFPNIFSFIAGTQSTGNLWVARPEFPIVKPFDSRFGKNASRLLPLHQVDWNFLRRYHGMPPVFLVVA